MDSDDDSYGIGDDSDDVSSDSSDDYGTEVGEKRKRVSWEERARAAAAAALVEKKNNPGMQCFVCSAVGKRGYVPNLTGLLQHCRTKEEKATKHKKFLKFIEEEMRAQPAPDPSAEPDVEGCNVLDLQKKMAAVTPFILVLQNIGSMGVDELCEVVASVAKEKPVVVLPDSKCCAFAILERFRSLELAHATFEARCRDRVHWNAFRMCMNYNTAQGSQQVFGYMANHEDMQELDPEKNTVAWEIQDFSDAVMQPHREALEEQQQLILKGRELDGEVRKAIQNYEHYQSIHVKWAKAVEDAKQLVSQRQDWLEQETAVLEKEKEYSEKKFKQEKESLRKEHERKVKELEEMEKYQATANNGMDVQKNLARLRLEVKNAEKEVEKVNSDHDKFVQEVIRNKRELDERKKQKSAMEAEWELNAKRKKELVESEKNTNEEIARLQKELEKRSNDDTCTSQQHMKNLKFLEECGLTTERLRQITISACKSCGIKLSKPPKPSQSNHPKYSEALKKARVLLRPCGCITICSGCAPKAVRARRCPCCNKQFSRNEKMEEVPFPIFGYITLE